MESENVQPFTKQHVMNCLIIIYVKKNHTILSIFYTAFRFWINLNQIMSMWNPTLCCCPGFVLQFQQPLEILSESDIALFYRDLYTLKSVLSKNT